MSKVHVFLTLDPETERISMSEEEPGDGYFPRGRRGRSWPRREAYVDEASWKALLAGEMPPDEQDTFHQTTWQEAT